MAYVGDHQVGLGEESTVGTAVTPTRFLEVTDESLKFSIDRVESKSLRTGRRVLSTTGWAANKQTVDGNLGFEVGSAGFGLLFKHMLGASATTTVTGSVKKHSATVGTLDGKGLTAEVVRTDVTGTKHKFVYAGNKVDGWELKGAAGEFLDLSLTLDGWSETATADSGTTATYPTQSPLVYTGATISIAGSTVANVKGFSLKGDNIIAKDRYMLSPTGISQVEQVEAGGLRKYDGQLDCEWSGLTQYQRFTAGTLASVSIVYQTATVLSGSTYGSVTVTLPNVRFDGETPVGGGQIVEHSLPFVALDDQSGTSPITIDYVTLDATP